MTKSPADLLPSDHDQLQCSYRVWKKLYQFSAFCVTLWFHCVTDVRTEILEFSWYICWTEPPDNRQQMFVSVPPLGRAGREDSWVGDTACLNSTLLVAILFSWRCRGDLWDGMVSVAWRTIRRLGTGFEVSDMQQEWRIGLLLFVINVMKRKLIVTMIWWWCVIKVFLI